MTAAHLRRSVRTARVLIVAIATAIGAACGSDGGGRTTGPAPTGSLMLTVVSTDGFAASVHISGPSGYTHSVTSSTMLIGLPVGSYTASADSSARVQDSIVGTSLFKAVVTGSPATVARGDTARISATYVRERRGALWVAHTRGASAVESFGVDQLGSSRTLVPVGSAPNEQPDGMTFDSAGNMWASGQNTNEIRKYVLNRLSVTGNVTSDASYIVGNIYDPQQMAFDKNGILWIADRESGLVGLTSAQLTSGELNVVGLDVQDSAANSFGQEMRGIAFDDAGNAWATEIWGGNAIVEFSHAQIAAPGAKTPVTRITGDFGSLASLAFDAHGNLWVADEGTSALFMFTPVQLAAGGRPVPTVTIATATPAGLAFDNSGSLWVTNSFDSKIYEFTASELTTSGSPSPHVTLTLGTPGPDVPMLGNLAFDSLSAVTPEPAP